MLETAIEAAAEAGKLLRREFGSQLTVNQATHHDIKLAIDEQAQQVISRVILADYPDHAILGEEGVSGRPDADVRWVVDPLDGTVNYFYNIPHYSVSIAAQQRLVGAASPPRSSTPGRGGDAAPTEPERWETIAGVVYAPEVDELFAAEQGKPATLNEREIRVSDRAELEQAIVGIGFFKSADTIRASLGDFQHLISQVRKMRLMGSAALDVVYVACGRYDAYIEHGIKLWDICAGQLILENAGGRTAVKPTGQPHTLDMVMWNAKLKLEELKGGATG